MTSWTLVVFILFGNNQGQNIVIPNLVSYQECVRTYNEVSSMEPNLTTWVSSMKCIEVRNK